MTDESEVLPPGDYEGPPAAAESADGAVMAEGACPYLGMVGDPNSHHSFPSRLHLCHAGEPAHIGLGFQADYCLGGLYPSCARYQRAEEAAAAGMPVAATAAVAGAAIASTGAASLPPGATTAGYRTRRRIRGRPGDAATDLFDANPDSFLELRPGERQPRLGRRADVASRHRPARPGAGGRAVRIRRRGGFVQASFWRRGGRLDAADLDQPDDPPDGQPQRGRHCLADAGADAQPDRSADDIANDWSPARLQPLSRRTRLARPSTRSGAATRSSTLV